MNERKLQIVDGEALTRRLVDRANPPLSAAPFRPGELPAAVLIDLGSARVLAANHASNAGVPLELWLRIALECRRTLGDVASAFAVSRERVEDLLDGVAKAQSAPLRSISFTGLHSYTNALRVADRAPLRIAPRRTVRVLAPDQLVAGWLERAARVAETLNQWAQQAVLEVPAHCVSWESAAAASCASLGEWAFAAAATRVREPQTS